MVNICRQSEKRPLHIGNIWHRDANILNHSKIIYLQY